MSKELVTEPKEEVEKRWKPGQMTYMEQRVVF